MKLAVPKSGLIYYFLIGLMFSILNTLRLTFEIYQLRYLIIIFYYLYYSIIPAYVFTSFFYKKLNNKLTLTECILWSFIVVYLFIFIILIDRKVSILNDEIYFSLFHNVIISSVLGLILINTQNKKYFLNLMLSLIVLLGPLLSASIGYYYISRNIDVIESNNEKVKYVVTKNNQIIISSWGAHYLVRILRSENSFLKYLISGIGSCGETANHVITILNEHNILSRKVNFQGEDHSFIEYYENNTWYVVDPGYFGSTILTREERGNRRMEEYGSITCVYTYNETEIVDLTEYYTNTDTIHINILKNTEKVANVKVQMQHLFRDVNWTIPIIPLYTNINGSVIFKLGNTLLNEKANPYTNYYTLIINDEITEYKIQSEGEGNIKNFNIEIE